jgi:hypothetical protein
MAATGSRLVAVGAAALLVGAGAGCAQEYDGADLETASPIGFEATPSYVGAAVDLSSSDPYRYSMTFSFDLGGQSTNAELATGAFDGERSQMDMDLSALFENMGAGLGEEIPDELADADLTVQQVTDTDALYIRAPYFAALGDLFASEGGDIVEASGGALFDVLSQLGDDWGRVDLEVFGDALPPEAQQVLSGGQGTDPRRFLDVLRETDDVEDLGTDVIDGVEVHGLAARVDFGDLMEAAGTGGMTESVGGSELDDLGSLGFPLEVWIDGDEHIRRIGYSYDAETFGELAEESGDDVSDLPSELRDFSVGMTMDFTDYGDGSIEISPPEGAIDITDDFVAAYEDMAGG